MSVRVYLPLVRSGLDELVRERYLAGPLPAHAVTEALREAWPEGDEEDHEYAALAAAGAESWQLLGGPGRRVVVALDVDAVEPRDGEPTAVLLPDGARWRQVVSGHLDVEEVAGLRDDEDGPDLAWFARQELADQL